VSDLELSRVGLGCNNFGGRIDFEATRAVVDAALEEGVTHFDTADVYGNRGESERFLGRLLEGRRDRVVLATKFGSDMGDGTDARGSADYVRRACDASLERLRTDRLDLYYSHRPDGITPVAETLGALSELVEAGKVLHVGCSNVSAAQLREAEEAARARGLRRFEVVQNEYSLLERDAEADVLPAARELGIGFVPYFPLASGLLTGKYRRGAPAPEGTRLHGRDEPPAATWDRIEALEAFAVERGHTLLELAVAALASTPGVVSVICGATKAEQVRANAAAAEWRLSADELSELKSL
jgi:aryl-alcohol dehydrogenase-like predicted oxidoreductase